MDKLERQIDLDAVSLKLHPVHGGFAPNNTTLYPVYWLCQQRGLPVFFHRGTSAFPDTTTQIPFWSTT